MSTDTLELIDLDIDFDLEVQCEDDCCESSLPATWRTTHQGCSYVICVECRWRDLQLLGIESHVFCQCGSGYIPVDQIRFYPL